MIRITVNSSTAKAMLDGLTAALQPAATNLVLQKVAYETWRSLVERTPRRFTGMTRRAWTVLPLGGRGYLVTNPSKVMKFLEYGTKAHGPRKKKFLYIPLNRNAAIKGWYPALVRGRDYILVKRVRGIRARKIVATEVPRVHARLQIAMTEHIRSHL